MKFRLLDEHVTAEGAVLPAGTEVGDDTPHPWKNEEGNYLEPSTQMEGLDDEGSDAVRKLHRYLFGRPPRWELPRNEEVRKAHEKAAKEQADHDARSAPVSPQQDVERKALRAPRAGEAAMAPTVAPRGALPTVPQGAPVVSPPGAGRQPSHTAHAAPTRGGVTHPSPGPATPQPSSPARPTNPNRDMPPKDG